MNSDFLKISLKEFVHVDVVHIYYVCQKLSLKYFVNG